MNIGEASKASGVSTKMIRHYESIGLLRQAQRTDSGYRVYGDNDVQTLRFIRRSRDLGFSIERIRTLLNLWQNQSRRSADVKALATQYIAELDEDIAKLQSIRAQLTRLQGCCHGDQRPDCPILEELGAGKASGAG
ncbi:MAG: Cu(I)-responsive transcriptional regulator [Limnobacter sp.]|uniref:Cu(I)-responsive transcriptional regulator n=1 Tax=Limnobacter sp. TaxID=2003368 RepID=UPI00391B1C85